jgi:hypothetical protein
MNEFFARITEEKDPLIVQKTLVKNSFDFKIKSIESFRKLFDLKKVPCCTNESCEIAKHAYGSPLKKQGELPSKKEEPTLTLEFKTLAEIWLESTKHREFTSIVYNPRPLKMQTSTEKKQFNAFKGFAPGFSRDDVLKYKDWDALVLFMNHIRYTWCDDNEQFAHVLSWMACILQKPWVKTFTTL